MLFLLLGFIIVWILASLLLLLSPVRTNQSEAAPIWVKCKNITMAPKRARPASARSTKKLLQVKKTGPLKRVSSDKYVHVHYFLDTGRWGAWVLEPKRGGKRIYAGTHLTDRLAARCQDRALLKLETDPSMTKPIKLNFHRKDYEEDEHLRNTLTHVDFFKLLRGESHATYSKVQPTACLSKFLAQEQALGNLPISSKTGSSIADFGPTTANGSAINIVPFVIDVEPLASIAPVDDVPSPATMLRWNCKRRRSTKVMLSSDEKDAIEGLLHLSSMATISTTD